MEIRVILPRNIDGEASGLLDTIRACNLKVINSCYFPGLLLHTEKIFIIYWLSFCSCKLGCKIKTTEKGMSWLKDIWRKKFWIHSEQPVLFKLCLWWQIKLMRLCDQNGEDSMEELYKNISCFRKCHVQCVVIWNSQTPCCLRQVFALTIPERHFEIYCGKLE